MNKTIIDLRTGEKITREMTASELIEWQATQPSAAQQLQAAKDIKNDAIETSFKAACESPLSYMGTTFAADAYAQDLMVKTSIASNLPGGFAWFDINDNPVPMTKPQFQGMIDLLVSRGNNAFIARKALRASVKNAADITSVNNVVVS